MEEKLYVFLNKVFLAGIVLVAGILVFFVGQILLQDKAINQQNQYQIMVSGEGKVYVKPDVALISLGVTTQGATVADVTKNNTDKMNAVIEAVKELGVDEKDIQTTNYNLSPRYANTAVPLLVDYVSSVRPVQTTQTIVGYALEQDVQVKIRDFSKIGDIVSHATAKGSNLVGSLQFTIDNPEQSRQAAREKAIKQAKDNAQNLAKSSGIKIGKLINVYESYYPVYSGKTGGMGGAFADSSLAVPTIQPGQQEIDVTISLVYQVK